MLRHQDFTCGCNLLRDRGFDGGRTGRDGQLQRRGKGAGSTALPEPLGCRELRSET